MKFLLPTKIPQFDFQFQLLASQDYWTNFKQSPLKIAYSEDVYIAYDGQFDEFLDYCPVGSIEFCSKHGINTFPRNIPPQLKDYACGLVCSNRDEMKDSICYWHVKSAKQIKHPKNGMYTDINDIPFEDGEFQAVEYLEDGFLSEWRVFVLDGNIIDLQNYAGDIWTLPSKNSVENMIYFFEHAKGSNCPPAYTLDVGVHQDDIGLKTSIVEVHDFYACGTYNFNDHYHYPIMLWEWWNWYRKTIANVQNLSKS